jgi:hypothetical protein
LALFGTILHKKIQKKKSLFQPPLHIPYPLTKRL